MNTTIPTRQLIVTVDGVRYSVRVDPERGRDANKIARAFVFGPGDDLPTDGLKDIAALCGAPNIDTKRGDYPTLDSAWDAFNRAIVAAKRRVLDAALKAMFPDDASPFRPKFSRYAGCSCPCSPGFIVNGARGVSIYIENLDAIERRKAEQAARKREDEELALLERIDV